MEPWGDVSDLVAVLDVQLQDDGSYVGPVRASEERPVVEASQILGQAIVAGARHAPGRRAVNVSMIFTRVVDARAPYAIELEEVAGGRTFSGLVARATQGGRVGAVGTLLLDVTAPDVMRHAVSAAAVAGPDDSAPYDMGVTGRDIRVVDDAYNNDPDAPVGPPILDAWVRYAEVPDDPAMHAALVAQFIGHMSIAAAMRPHAGIGQSQAHRTLSTGVNALNLAMHADVRADQWLLYHHHSTFAGDGMTHSSCTVHDQAGALLASFTADCMVRAMPDPTKADARTSL
jgi:acyl-CoA thioesterase II